MKPIWKKRIGRALALLGLAAVLFFLPPMPQEYRDLRADSSLNLTDRHGVPLRRNLSAREGVNSWTSLEEMPPILIDAVLAAEDKRFSYHPGPPPSLNSCCVLYLHPPSADGKQSSKASTGPSEWNASTTKTKSWKPI